jgi:hypothetical protein
MEETCYVRDSSLVNDDERQLFKDKNERVIYILPDVPKAYFSRQAESRVGVFEALSAG